MERKIFVVSLIVMLFGCAGSPTVSENSIQSKVVDVPVDFSGHWELDYKLTEDPRDKLRWLYEVARAQVGQSSRRDKNNPGSVQTIRAINDLNGIIRLGKLTESMTRSTVLGIRQSGDYIVVEREGDFALTCDFFSQEQELSLIHI